jgi:hypothetical protein
VGGDEDNNGNSNGSGHKQQSTKRASGKMLAAATVKAAETATACRKLPSYVLYKGTYVPYNGTFGAPDQGQTLDV